jgi:hypothetical protein
MKGVGGVCVSSSAQYSRGTSGRHTFKNVFVLWSEDLALALFGHGICGCRAFYSNVIGVSPRGEVAVRTLYSRRQGVTTREAPVLGGNASGPPLCVGETGQTEFIAVVVVVPQHLILVGLPVIVCVGEEVDVALEWRRGGATRGPRGWKIGYSAFVI